MAKSIIEGITNYFMKCPLLKEGAFRVDALGDQGIEYAIETSVFDPVIKRYVNGSTLRQYQFDFGSREFYSMDRIENIQNSAFYEEFSDWVEKQNKLQNFPELPDDCTPEALEVLSPGYFFDGSMRNARYKIQLRLIYLKEAI